MLYEVNFASKRGKRRSIVLCSLEEDCKPISGVKMKELVGANGDSKVTHIGESLGG